MLQLIRCATLSLAACVALVAFGQPGDEPFGLPPGEHAVGFQLLEDVDGSRSVTGGQRGAAHSRPIRTYLWYPAELARGTPPLTFGRYAALADDDIWPREIAGELRERLRFANGPLARSLSEREFAALLAKPMRAGEHASPLAGPFPLIVIGLGLYYESPVTFAATAEYLAGRGFVVATAPLVGTDTALVKLDVADLETQVRDLEVVIERARRFSFVDSDRLGVMGFDLGAMAGVVLTMRNRDVDAFVSLDSSIQYRHPSGLPRSSPHYDALALRVPWLHAASRADGPPPPEGTKSLFDEAAHSERYWLHIADLDHGDFTSYALVDGRRDAAGYWRSVTPAASATHRVVMEWVLHFFAAHLARSDVSMALLEQALRELPANAGMTLDFRAATPAPIDYDEVVRKVVGGHAEEAVADLRALAAQSPEHPLLSEFNLARLCVSLLYTWSLPEETLPIVQFAAERYPSSQAARAAVDETRRMIEALSTRP